MSSPNLHLVILVAATGVLLLVVWQTRREKFETPEERKERKIAEARAKVAAIGHSTGSYELAPALDELALRLGREPMGYAERLKRKLKMGDPRTPGFLDAVAKAKGGQIIMDELRGGKWPIN